MPTTDATMGTSCQTPAPIAAPPTSVGEGVGGRAKFGLRLGRLVACCLGVVVLWACGPVYIPVPPPSQTIFTRDSVVDSSNTTVEVWIATGGEEPKAADGTYYLFDQERNAGVIAAARADGSYQAPAMPGSEGDHVLVNYRDALGKLSATACLILDEHRPYALVCP